MPRSSSRDAGDARKQSPKQRNKKRHPAARPRKRTSDVSARVPAKIGPRGWILRFRKHAIRPEVKARLRTAERIFAVIILVIALFVTAVNSTILNATSDRIFDNVADLPYNEAALLLGTSRRLSSGGLNPDFTYRVDAAVDLFNAGRVSYIIASGNKEQRYYDEPEEFRKELVLRGVPDERIILDGKGYRTIDSVARCREIFGFDRCTIVTQRFHAPRAIYLADFLGVEAVAYAARDVEPRKGAKTVFREVFARVKAFTDITISKYHENGRRK